MTQAAMAQRIRGRRCTLLMGCFLVLAATIPLARPLSTAAVSPQGPTNLISNPGFETGGGPSGPSSWTASGTTAWESGTSHSGTHSVSVTGGGGNWTSTPLPPGAVGAYREVSAWIIPPAQGTGSDTADITVTFLDGSGTTVSTYQTGNIESGCSQYYYSWAGAWCYQYAVVAVPSGTASVIVKVETGSSDTGKLYIDDVDFSQIVSDAVAAGSQIPASMPTGQGSVQVNAGQTVQQLSTLMAGDNALYTGTALDTYWNDPVLRSTVRSTEHPGIIRFPGGDYSPQYDWEHPTDGVSAGLDIDSLMQYVRAIGAGDVLWTLNFSGAVNTFSVRYAGNASHATLSVSSSSLDIALSGTQTDGSQGLHVDFLAHPTIGAVLSFINGQPGYTASYASGEATRANDPVDDELVKVGGLDATAPAGQTIQVDIGNVHKALRLEDYANNPTSTVVGPSGLTRDQYLTAHSLPTGPYNIHYFEVGNETWNTPSMTPLTPPQAANKVVQFAQALHNQDASVKVGMSNTSLVQGADSLGCCGSGGAEYVFNMIMDQVAGPYIDFVVDHPYNDNFDVSFDAMLAFPQHLARINNVAWDREIFAENSPDHRTNIGVFTSEFNIVTYATQAPSPLASPNYELVNGLVTADELGTLMTQGVTSAAMWDQLDYPYGNYVVWGTNPTNVAVEPASAVIGLFNQHFGQTLVADSYQSPTYDIPSVDAPRASMPPGGSGSAYPWQTSYSSVSTDGTTLYIMLINKSGADPRVSSDQAMPITTQINLQSFVPQASATAWTFNSSAGGDRGSWNVDNSEHPTVYNAGAFGVSQSGPVPVGTTFSYITPAHSVTVLVLTRAA